MTTPYFRFLCLGSGSSGNCFIYQTPQGSLMIDAGIGIRKLTAYLLHYDIPISSIKAIFLTHDHIDHIKSAASLAKKYSLPIYATKEVWHGIDSNPVIRHKVAGEFRRFLTTDTVETCCGCSLKPFPVPHDSKGNVGYFITWQDIRLCHITDIGHITDTILQHIERSEYLVIESNYDNDMLMNGPYPYPLKMRIAGNNGHLSNTCAAETIFRHSHHLKHTWLCHLSENNNTPQHALDAMKDIFAQNHSHLDITTFITVLKRTSPTGFFNLS